MNQRIFIIMILVLSINKSFAQTGQISGRVFNEINNESIPFADIIIEGSQIGTISDEDGNYLIDNLKPGTYNVIGSFWALKKLFYMKLLLSQLNQLFWT